MSPDALFRVVVTGSECTGKTTLAEALADHYRTLWVLEFARQFVEEKGAPPDASDVDIIARGQIEIEEVAAHAARQRDARILLLDTDLLSTVVYARHYYGRVPGWVEQALRDRRADLYLLADIDVPWEPDGHQRDRPENREAMQDLFRSALDEFALPLLGVSGTQKERLEAAVRTIDASLSAAERSS